MVTELAQFSAQPGKADALEQGLRAAMAVIRRGDGCRAIRLRRCVEDPNIFLYEIEWETLEHHIVTFRGGPLFAEYRAHIAGLFVDPPAAHERTANMVTELAQFSAQPGKADALAQGLRAAMAVIRRGDGCRAIRLRRCVEDPNIFLYEIEWETLEHHTVTFRGGPLFAEYRAHIAGLFVDPPAVRHYAMLGG